MIDVLAGGRRSGKRSVLFRRSRWPFLSPRNPRQQAGFQAQAFGFLILFRTIISGVAHYRDETATKGIALSFYLPDERVQIGQLIGIHQTLEDVVDAVYEEPLQFFDFGSIHHIDA